MLSTQEDSIRAAQAILLTREDPICVALDRLLYWEYISCDA